MASPNLDFVGPHADVLAASDPPDVAQLFRTYAPYVAAIALRLLGREDEVDDVVQAGCPWWWCSDAGAYRRR